MPSSPHIADTKGFEVSPARRILATPVGNLMASRVRSRRTAIAKDFYRFEFPAWVNIIALTEKGELVVIRQYRFGTGRIEWEIPGGSVNTGEDPLLAGLRELREETGFVGENGRIIGKVCPNPAIQDNFCYTVLVECVRRSVEPDLDDMEEIEVLTLPQDAVQKLVAEGAINHGLVLNALMFFAMHKKTKGLP